MRFIIFIFLVFDHVISSKIGPKKCDRAPNCVDSSDEIDCPCEGGDEILSLLRTAECGECEVDIRRLNNLEECHRLSLNSCDNSTCYKTPSLNCSTNDCNTTDVICTSQLSHCTDNNTETCSAFQCSDGSLILASQFCDGKSDCPDDSDETRNKPGFKCTLSKKACVLPQRNLYDNVAHCVNGSDLCVDGNCFECFDKRLLILSKQVCDGVIDCFDLSDECLCQINIDKPICDALFTFDNNSTSFCVKNPVIGELDPNVFANTPLHVYALHPDSNITVKQLFTIASDNLTQTITNCETKFNKNNATMCDGRPECKDFSDECNCENPPAFCNDSCRSFHNSSYPPGDLYCDGVEDEFEWSDDNKSACPPGFDEKLCPKRFRCKSDDEVSIDVLDVCNGVANCDDKSDEYNCPVSTDVELFASDGEMIADVGLRSAVWIIAVIVLLGNFAAITTKLKFLRKTSLSDSLRCQHLIILNISFADCLMGIYLLAIAVFSATFSGYYRKVDAEWRASLRCSIIGSLAVISGETTCFLMVTLTAFRLYGICRPFASETSPTWPWKLCIYVAWLISLILGFLPILHQFVPYFVYRYYFQIQFSNKGMWTEAGLTKFACRYAAMMNKTFEIGDNKWESAQIFLEKNFPEQFPLKVFGYYGETSVCMPRFFVQNGDSSWEYSLAIITINFLCFVFIAVGYITILLESNKISQKESIMQRRIARIITTDLCCWIPICVLAYVRISGTYFPTIIYQISAVLILPINSALNPFLYSALLDKVMKKITYWKEKQFRSNDIPLPVLQSH